MIKIQSLCFICLFTMTASNLTVAQGAFKNEDISFDYDPYKEVWFDYHITEKSDSFHIYFRLDFINQAGPDKDYHIFYELRESYEVKPSDSIHTLTLAKDCIDHNYSSFIYKCSVPKSNENNLLIFHVSKTGGNVHYIFDVPLRLSTIFPYPDLTIYSANSSTPITRSFVHSGDSVYIRSVNPDLQKVSVFRYLHNFEAADPPMYLLDKNVKKDLSYDSVFEVDPGQVFTFAGKGLYFIQSDTSSLIGLSVRCEEEHYPKLVLMDDIFEPIIYMSTYDEIEKLKQSVDKKKAFETYWLKITKSQERARKLIREFYKRIEEADNFFTTYKEGWKTDMGMIYIFFGPPDVAYDDGVTQKWYYAKKGDIPSVNFTFVRLRNIFSSQHYILERDENYRSQWFKRIDSWRRGYL